MNIMEEKTGDRNEEFSLQLTFDSKGGPPLCHTCISAGMTNC
jgi:hypothetical protein